MLIRQSAPTNTVKIMDMKKYGVNTEFYVAYLLEEVKQTLYIDLSDQV